MDAGFDSHAHVGATAYRADKTEKFSPLKKAAAECLKKSGDSVSRATELLEKRVRKSKALRDELTDPLLAGACYDLISGLVHRDRARIMRSMQNQHPDTSASLFAQAQSLLDFPLPGGKRLKDADASDLRNASRLYTKQSETMAKRARWLARIAETLPDDKRVGEVFDADKLSALHEAA